MGERMSDITDTFPEQVEIPAWVEDAKLTRGVLLKARNLITIEGRWQQGGAGGYDDNGAKNYCLGGAIAKAVTDDPQEMYNDLFAPVLREFIRRAELPVRTWECQIDPDTGAVLPEGQEFAVDPDTTIFEWNDEGGRTVEEVLALLDKVIDSFNEE